MGIDAKGRNFSAPRLTPGVRHELMTYGSPEMIKDQDRKIAVMEDRARRYGYMTTANNYSQYGGVTARPLGTSEGITPRPPVQRPMTTRTTQADSVKSIIKVIVIFFVVVQVIIPMIVMLLAALANFE